MPVIVTSAFGIVEDVLLDARAIVNDMEIPGGDVLTDNAPFSLRFVSLAYRNIQSYLAQYGVETFSTYFWLLAIPINSTGDPESRVIISDSGTEIFTPSGSGESTFAEPILPNDLINPLKLAERQNGTSCFAVPMFRRNDGIASCLNITTRLIDWEWVDNTVQFRGASQTQDVRMKYEKQLPELNLVTDPVPIRGVDNAAAYQTAAAFANSRGSTLAPGFGTVGQQEIDLLVNRSVRERQRVKHRRQPYRGYRGSNSYRR